MHPRRPWPVPPMALALTLAIGLAFAVLPVLAVPPSTTRLNWAFKANMPIGLYGVAFAAAPNGKLYAVGGYDGTKSYANVDEYDPAANTWTAKAPLPTPRYGLGLVAASNGKLYAVGGIPDAMRTVVDEYDPVADTWTSRAPLPTARFIMGLVAASNGRLYAIGGSFNGNNALSAVDEYDPTTNTWTAKAPLPAARHSLGAAAAPNGKLYAIGGSATAGPGQAAGTSTVQEYDPATNTWAAKSTMGRARYGLSAVAAPNGKLYAIGGDPVGTPNDWNIVEEYDPVADAWTARPPMPTERTYFGLAAAPNGRLYAIGGNNGTAVARNQVDEYDLATHTWIVPVALPWPLPTPARQQAASAVAGGRLFLFGGLTSNGDPLDQVQEYDPGTDSWRPVASLSTARYGAAAALAPNGRIYLVGGTGSGGELALLEEFTPPVNGVGFGSWRTAPQVAQPQVRRGLLAFAAAPNGKLYAAGGFGYPPGSDFGFRLSIVEEYDPAANAWRFVAPMNVARDSLGLALAGDGKLYAVGGAVASGFSSVPTAAVERFTPPTGPSDPGSWSGPSGVGQLPAARSALGLVGAPSGNLYALGGAMPTTDFTIRDRPEVYEYDPTANAWTQRARMLTERRALSVGLLGNRLHAVAGFNRNNVQVVNEAAILDRVPTVSAGGPYTVASGSSVQLSATGADLDGGVPDLAWDLDGDLLYETPGPTATFSTVGLAPGVRTVRVRAVDAEGAYAVDGAQVIITAVPAPTLTPVPTTPPVATLCGPRPAVRVTTAVVGAGRLQATIAAQTSAATPTNALSSVRITRVENATATIDGSPVAVGDAVNVPAGTAQVALTVQRQAPGQASTVAFIVTDGCGQWPSFVGGGPGAF